MSKTTKPANRLLAALPEKEYERLLFRSEPFDLNFNETLYQPDGIINDVYFPESGFITLLSTAERRASIRVAVIGNEGLIGLPVFLGTSKSINLAVVEGAGTALKMKSVDLLNICELGGVLPYLLRRYTNLFITQINQILICTRFHPIESQLILCLLMTQDRTETSELSLTHESLSKRLGVRREAVTKIIGTLRQRELITYNRGNLLITNRIGLEVIACSCYQSIKKEEQNFLN